MRTHHTAKNTQDTTIGGIQDAFAWLATASFFFLVVNTLVAIWLSKLVIHRLAASCCNKPANDKFHVCELTAFLLFLSTIATIRQNWQLATSLCRFAYVWVYRAGCALYVCSYSLFWCVLNSPAQDYQLRNIKQFSCIRWRQVEIGIFSIFTSVDIIVYQHGKMFLL